MHGRMAYEAEKMKRLGPQDNTLIDFMWKLIGQPVFLHARMQRHSNLEARHLIRILVFALEGVAPSIHGRRE